MGKSIVKTVKEKQEAEENLKNKEIEHKLLFQ